MTAVNGPKVVSDGLVFAMDMNNTQKSWKGKPTTNYYQYSYPNYVNWNYQTIQVSYPSPEITKLYTDSAIAFNAISWSGGSYGANADTNTKLSYTAKVRGKGDARLQVHQANVNPNSGHSGISSDALTLSNEWQTIELKNFYHANNVSAQNVLVTLTAGSNNYVEIKEPQIEFSDHPTPYIKGSRSSSNSIKDLLNNSSVNISSLTYDSDNTFSFTNSNEDRIVVTHNSNILIGDEFSIELWINPAATQDNSYPYMMYKGSLLAHINQNPVNSYVALNVSTPTDGLRQTVATSIVNPNIWQHVVCSYDGQYGRIYYNGELKATRNFGSVVSITSSTSDLYIGGNNTTGRAFNGSISEYRQYNRVLTADEVLNNYEATKNKYI